MGELDTNLCDIVYSVFSSTTKGPLKALFLINQYLIRKLYYHVLKGNYPNNSISNSKTCTFRTRVGCGTKNPGGGGVYKQTFFIYLKIFLDDLLLAHDSRDHGAHLGLKID